MLVRYEQKIIRLRTTLAVAGLDDVAKAGPSFEDRRKFPDSKEKEDIESIGVEVREEGREEEIEGEREEEKAE